MFLDSSRYAKVRQAQVKTRDGRDVTAVTIRRLPATTGDDTLLTGPDRLDTIAFRKYLDGTRFWHVADANTELDSRKLPQPKPEGSPQQPVVVIKVPAN
jgi:hypothetical protein